MRSRFGLCIPTAVFAAGLAIVLPASADIESWPDVSAAVDALYAGLEPHQTGGVTAIIHGGEVIHLKGYGAANRELDVPWTPDLVYQIASLTKSITASAVLEVADSGCLSLDDEVQRHLPEFPRFDAPLTIRHLLTMTSGLWQDEVLLPLSGVGGAVSPDELYAMSLAQTGLEYPPGSTFRYTDTNFRMLARIVAACVGAADWDEALRRVMFEPLGMTSSSAPWVFWRFEDDQVPTYLTGPDGKSPIMLDVHLPITGDGGVRTTMRDLIKWLLYMRESVEQGREGVQQGQSRWHRLNQTMTLANGETSGYRLGIYEIEHRGLKGIGHGGVTGTQYVFFPGIDLIVAFFENDIGTLDLSRTLGGLIDAFLMSARFDASSLQAGSDWDRPFGTPPPPAPEAWLEGAAGFYVQPEDGFILELVNLGPGVLGASYRGSAPHALSPAGERVLAARYRVGAPQMRVNLGSEPAAVEVQLAEWPVPRRFVRATRTEDYPAPAGAEGFYHSDALDAVYTLRHEDGALVMRIGSGRGPAQKFRLAKLNDEVFEAIALEADFYDLAMGLGRFGVVLHRSGSGGVDGLHITTDRIKRIDFRKLAGKREN